MDTGGDLVLTGVRKLYGPVRARCPQPGLPSGRGRRARRRERRRQVDDDGHHRRIRARQMPAPSPSPAGARRRRYARAHRRWGSRWSPRSSRWSGSCRVAENLLLGQRPEQHRVLVDWRAMDRPRRTMLERVGLDVPLRRRVDSLSVAQRQLIEIAKALGHDPQVLILDEPTSALGPTESDRVLEIARGHAAAGGIVIFVGHRLKEVRRVADRIVVLRNGRLSRTSRRRWRPRTPSSARWSAAISRRRRDRARGGGRAVGVRSQRAGSAGSRAA